MTMKDLQHKYLNQQVRVVKGKYSNYKGLCTFVWYSDRTNKIHATIQTTDGHKVYPAITSIQLLEEPLTKAKNRWLGKYVQCFNSSDDNYLTEGKVIDVYKVDDDVIALLDSKCQVPVDSIIEVSKYNKPKTIWEKELKQQARLQTIKNTRNPGKPKL